MIRTAILGVSSLFVATPALAGTLFTASLTEPVTERTTFVANSAVWVCEGDTCTAELDRRNPTVRSCKKVAEEIGTLASFSSERGTLEAEDLAKCNEAADD